MQKSTIGGKGTLVKWGIIYLVTPFIHNKTFKVGFYGGSDGKESAGNARDSASIPGSGRFFGEGNSNPICILAWRIPWTEEPGGLESIESQRVGQYWVTNTFSSLLEQTIFFRLFLLVGG